MIEDQGDMSGPFQILSTHPSSAARARLFAQAGGTFFSDFNGVGIEKKPDPRGDWACQIYARNRPILSPG
jgi:hypothetical protein